MAGTTVAFHNAGWPRLVARISLVIGLVVRVWTEDRARATGVIARTFAHAFEHRLGWTNTHMIQHKLGLGIVEACQPTQNVLAACSALFFGLGS